MRLSLSTRFDVVPTLEDDLCRNHVDVRVLDATAFPALRTGGAQLRLGVARALALIDEGDGEREAPLELAAELKGGVGQRSVGTVHIIGDADDRARGSELADEGFDLRP